MNRPDNILAYDEMDLKLGIKSSLPHVKSTLALAILLWECSDHPTMKPIPLLAYPIQNSSMSNTLVLDPFGGSGSTLIACEQTDRDCYTIELDEKYCDVIVKRYIEQVGSADGVSVERDGKTYTFAELEVSDE